MIAKIKNMIHVFTKKNNSDNLNLKTDTISKRKKNK